MKNLTRIMLFASFTGIAAFTSCKKTSPDVKTVQTEQEDMVSVTGMNDAYANMVLHHDSFAHPQNPHHKQKHDSLYHHHDSLYNHHHNAYHHKDTSHHNKVHHTKQHHYKHDSLNIVHHKLPH